MWIQWVGAVITGVLLLLVVWGIWVVVASSRKQKRRERVANTLAEAYDVEPGMGLSRVAKHRRPGHLLNAEDNSLTVDELVEQATSEGRPVRLNWSKADEKQAGGQHPMKPGDDEEWPTGVLPRIED